MLGVPEEMADDVYKEMCYTIGNAVLNLTDAGFDPKKQLIADALRTSLVSTPAREVVQVMTIEMAIYLMER